MNVQMRHTLAGIATVVDDQPVTRRVDAFLPRNVCRDGQEMPQQRFVTGLGFADVRHVGLRQNEDVES